jgi:glyoxylase-like metal-dependent hydrolase (beta-lactamase superfamily II)
MLRRDLIKTLAASTLAATGISSLRAQANAEANPTQPPPQPTQPGFYRFQVGKFECIALNDGIGQMTPIQPTWAPEATAEEVQKALEKHYLPTDRLHVAFNSLVVRTPTETMLVDAGSGARARPRMGWTALQLAAAGIKAEEVTSIFLSHAHGDHLGGLLDEEGRAVFPNAQLHVSRAEWDFWLSESPDFSTSRTPQQQQRNAVELARRVFETLRPTARTFGENDKLGEGLSVIAAHGHTAGHSLLRIQSDGQEMVYLADLAHHPVLMFENPRWTVQFDVNPSAAAETRLRLFAELAAKRTRVHLFHMPFPGVGHIRTTGENSYEWVPEMWTVLG